MQFYGTKGRLVVEVPFNAPNDTPCRLTLYEGPGLGDVAVETIELPVCDQYGIMGDAFAAASRTAPRSRCRWRTASPTCG